jgi:hypothetical protein
LSLYRVYRVYRDVLGAEANAAIYRTALAQREVFAPSRVAHRGVDLRTRASRVVYGDRLGDVSGVLEAAVRTRFARAVGELGLPPFDIAGFEFQMTSHNDGDFFTRHTDNASRETAHRALTFVYYFHRDPAPFTGGELVFVDRAGRESVVAPGNDTLVLFDPRTTHQVRPIACPSGRFEDSRFTLNGWVLRSAPARRPAGAFDRRIFTSVGRWTAAPPRRPQGGTRRPSNGFAGHADALLRLYGDLHRTLPHPRAVDVRKGLSGTEFLEQYYARNRPVVIPGMLEGSEAVRSWSPEYFAARYGDVRVQITAGREAFPDYERRFRESLRTVTMRELAERLVTSEASNDFYLVARNNFFDNPDLRELRDALHPPDDIVDNADRRPGSAKLWLGPRGTVTPFHFDEHSILFTQVYGSKHFKLIPAFDHAYVYARDRYYSEVNPEAVDHARYPLFARASVMDVVVEPGDGLFIPVGWWHWAKSRSVSISATFSSFAWPWTNTRIELPDPTVSPSTP